MPEHSSKVLDLTYLIEACDADVVFIKDILTDYLLEMKAYVGSLDGLVKQGDLQSLMRAAHTVKGASANVGAGRVRETATKLEALARRGTLDGSESLIELLRNELGRVKDLIEREGVPALLHAQSPVTLERVL
jgi:HPt (histidine-containing phosphotransfer) domain-containing protein